MRSEDDLIAARPRGYAKRMVEIVGAKALVQGAAARKLANGRLPAEADPLVVRPANPVELSSLLALARGESIPVVVALDERAWESLPAGTSVLVDPTHLDSVIALDEVSGTVAAQAGISLGELEKALGRRGFTLGFPLDGEATRARLGALLALRWPPLASPALGPFFDSVVNVRFVLPDGTRVATRIAPRQATGPDLDGLVLGARGLLAIAFEATLAIRHKPEESQSLSPAFRSFPEALEGLQALIAGGIFPASARAVPARTRGARLLLSFAGSGPFVKAALAVARKLLREKGGRAVGAPEEGSPVAPEGARWAAGSFPALGRAVRSVSCLGAGPFHRDGGWVLAAGGSEPALQEAGCRLEPRALFPAERELLLRIKKELDPQGLLRGREG